MEAAKNAERLIDMAKNCNYPDFEHIALLELARDKAIMKANIVKQGVK